MTPAEIQKEIDDLEVRLERLRVKYDQYFLGIEKIPPNVLRKEVDRRYYALNREPMRNTALRFKFQSLLQRYTTYQTYWNRILRQIEEGTFQRDLIRAQRLGIALPKKPGAKPEITELDADLLESEDEVDAEGAPDYDDLHDTPAEPFVVPDWSPPPLPAAVPAVASVPSPHQRVPTGAMPVVALGPVPSSPNPPGPAASPVLAGPAAPPPASAASSARVGPPPRQRIVTAAMPMMAFGQVAVSPRPAGPATGPVPPGPGSPAAPSPAASSLRAPTLGAPALPAHPTPGRGAMISPFGALRARTPGRGTPVEAPAAVQPVAPRPPSPAPSPPAGERDPVLRQLYDRYVAARRQTGESTDVQFDVVARQVRETLPRLAEKYQGADVSLDVTIKDGKAQLRPVIKPRKK